MIHYHGTPINPEDVAVKILKRRHAMVSFANPECVDVVTTVAKSFAFDNGAFPIWRKGGSIDVPGYIRFVRDYMRHPGFDWCLIPDVIDGTESENDAHLGEWPMDRAISVPVWHLHESIERLLRLSAEYPRVALGSSGEFANTDTPRWWGRMADAMGAICDASGFPIVKLHGLRMLNPSIFGRIPLSSADSTNVAQNIGDTTRWNGTYRPMTRAARGNVLADRIEDSPVALRWDGYAAQDRFTFALQGTKAV